MNIGEVSERIGKLNNWSLEMGAIQKTFDFQDFKQAMAFANKIAEIAESEEHHPEIIINYNKVKLVLITHSAKGLTEKDFDVAEKIDKLDL